MHTQNILFIFVDDQKYNAMHALGTTDLHTPHMDRLIRDGLTFSQAHIPGGTCPAICMPSRAMLHTGRTLFHIEGVGENIPQNHRTLGETLIEHGYDSWGVGKWHNGHPSYARSFCDGGKVLFAGMWDHWNVPYSDYHAKEEDYSEGRPFILNFEAQRNLFTLVADRIDLSVHSSELFADEGIRFLKEKRTDKPFFLYIAFMAPHDPRSMPAEYRDLYDMDTLQLPLNIRGEHEFDFGTKEIRGEKLAPYPRTEKVVREHTAEYYGIISHLDHEVGRVIAALEETGEYENTLIIFAGDNGLALGQHGLFAKQSCYEHDIRVPLIFCGPGIPSGQKVDEPVYLLDIFPTLCSLLGIDIPDTVEGKSFLPLLQGKDGYVPREALYLAYADRVRAVKKENWKLILSLGVQSPPHLYTRLFDLTADPYELNDLSEDPSCAQKRKELTAELIRLREEWDDRSHPLGKAFWNSVPRSYYA